MSSIAILGGSFSPPTTGHLQLANQILKFCQIDEVWLSPVYAHNHGKDLVHSEHRLAMCELACKQDSRIKTFDYEILHKIEGGTYNFISKLLSDPKYNQHRFHYVIGLDVANEFHLWTKFKELQELVPFIVHPRQGETRTVDWFLKSPHTYITDKNEISKVSSTQVRKWLKDNRYSRDFDRTEMDSLPPGVFQYIETKDLYA